MLAYICYEKSIRGLNWGWIRILLMCCGTTKPSVTLWMNCQLSFLKPYALLDKEVNVSTCLTNIQWGCESGHPTLNDKIFWPTGQEAYKRVFKSLDHAPGGEPDMDYCVSISPPSALGYFGKFVTSNQISQSYWTTPDHVSVETRSHFDSTHGSCLEQKVGFYGH